MYGGVLDLLAREVPGFLNYSRSSGYPNLNYPNRVSSAIIIFIFNTH